MRGVVPEFFILLTVCVCCCAITRAATDATLVGTVLDSNGRPLPGVTAVLRNHDLAFHEQGTVTNAQGEFRFSLVPPGQRFELTVSLPGFATIIFSDLSLESGRTLVQNVVLRPATDLKETVRVVARGQTLDTETVTASTTFTSTFIAELPLLGRDYQDILTLAPGVTDVNGTGNPNIHGARNTDVVTLVDGVSTTDPFTGLFGQNLNIESIQELEVITSAATAQYSRAQGGFASILTKSGGNEFKGTFKMYLRSDRLDGDGAGFEDPELAGGFPGTRLFYEQHYTDLKPFLSLSGPIVRDRLWFYLSGEYIHEETPINALTQAFIVPLYGHREFFKISWQIEPSHRLAFSYIQDQERNEFQGLDSLTNIYSGYTTSRGGPTLTLKESAVFTPSIMLESSFSWFDNSFSRDPSIDPDGNGNGFLYVDDRPELGGNGDGINDARERDPGEDWNLDSSFDLFEDLDHDTFWDAGEDLNGDGYVNYLGLGCEGYQHEDLNCNGELDRERDENLNGRLDPEEDVGIPCSLFHGTCEQGYIPGTKGNGRFDNEDRNGNQILDVVGDSGYTPFPFWSDTNGNGIPDPGEYRRPLPPDQEHVTDRKRLVRGPSNYTFQDHRTRLSWSEDLSLFVGEALGSHDLKLGAVFEREAYDSDTFRRSSIFYPTLAGPGPVFDPWVPGIGYARRSQVSASLGIPGLVNNTASGNNVGLYLQDTWRPQPNLTLGLGVRFDFEDLSSFGYTSFEPAAERRAFDAIMEASGVEVDPHDRIVNRGLCQDPLRSCGTGDFHLDTLTGQLRLAAFSRLTRNNQDVEILSRLLAAAIGGFDPNQGAFRQGLVITAPEEFGISNSNLAPRLSLSWDPWADGKTKVFGSWGRYYDKLFLRSMVQEQGPDTVSRTYAFDPDGIDSRGLPDNFLGAPIFSAPMSVTQVSRNLSTPYSDEWTAGLQRELVPEVLISLRYIHRDYHDQLQDVDINHHTEVDPVTGKLTDYFGDAACYALSCDNIPDGAPDLYVENFYHNRVLRLGNFNEQTYRGWELEFVRRLKRKWQLEASYTYSVSQGDAESFSSEIGNDPALTEFEPGFLDYDQRHVVKLNAIAFLPGDWRLGWTANWSSGLPFSAIAYYSDSDDVGYLQQRRIFGQFRTNSFGFSTENRNLHRNAATYTFNTRVMKSFVIGKAAASAFLEIYNLLNSDSLRVRILDQIPPQVIPSQDGTGVQPVRPSKVRVIGERDFGRRFQVGFQIDF